MPLPAKLRPATVPEFLAPVIVSKVILSPTENFGNMMSYKTVSALKGLTNPEPPGAAWNIDLISLTL